MYLIIGISATIIYYVILMLVDRKGKRDYDFQKIARNAIGSSGMEDEMREKEENDSVQKSDNDDALNLMGASTKLEVPIIENPLLEITEEEVAGSAKIQPKESPAEKIEKEHETDDPEAKEKLLRKSLFEGTSLAEDGGTEKPISNMPGNITGKNRSAENMELLALELESKQEYNLNRKILISELEKKELREEINDNVVLEIIGNYTKQA